MWMMCPNQRPHQPFKIESMVKFHFWPWEYYRSLKKLFRAKYKMWFLEIHFRRENSHLFFWWGLMYSEWHFFLSNGFWHDSYLFNLTWKRFFIFQPIVSHAYALLWPDKKLIYLQYSSQGKNYGHETLDFSQTTIWPNKAGQKPWKKKVKPMMTGILYWYIFFNVCVLLDLPCLVRAHKKLWIAEGCQ